MSTHADTASSHSHSRLTPLVVVCPNDVEWHHRILLYILFQPTSINQLGLAPCLFSTLGLRQSFLASVSGWVFWEAITDQKVRGQWYLDYYSGCHRLAASLYQRTQLLWTPSSIPETALSWFRGDNGSPVLPGVTFYPLSGPLNLAHIFVGKVFHKLPNLIISSCFLPGPWLV